MQTKRLTVRTFSQKAEALIAKSKLEDAGIECFLEGEASPIDLQWLTASPGYKLQVWEPDFKAALKLLNLENASDTETA
ncbi:MAG: hypothetical protein KDD39_08530 [Bdellovibrionales bacterium]|nr:hypothetical protein [Bdellovibrionales bacterium]